MELRIIILIINNTFNKINIIIYLFKVSFIAIIFIYNTLYKESINL